MRLIFGPYGVQSRKQTTQMCELCVKRDNYEIDKNTLLNKIELKATSNLAFIGHICVPLDGTPADYLWAQVVRAKFK